jgi:phage RecT family recombinase
MSTALTTIDKTLPIRDINVLNTLTQEEYFSLGCAFPDPELTEQQRIVGCQAFASQMISYVHTAKDPSILENCYAETVIETLQGCISVDLPLTRSLGMVALVPFKNCMTLMLQYQGLGELILRSQSVASLQSYLVYKGDKFEVILGAEPNVVHVPDMNGRRDANSMTHAYCIAHHKTGPIQLEIMNREELETVRKASKQPDGPAWKYWPTEMYRKAPARRIAKRIRKIVGGPQQIALTRGLQIEDSQFDHSRLDRYKELDNQRAREQLDAALMSSDKPLALPEPLPDRPAGWIEALGKTKVELWAKVQELRAKETDLSCTEWIEQVMYTMYRAEEISAVDKLDDPDDIEAVWDAVVNKQRFTLDTGEEIPELPEEGADPGVKA